MFANASRLQQLVDRLPPIFWSGGLLPRVLFQVEDAQVAVTCRKLLQLRATLRRTWQEVEACQRDTASRSLVEQTDRIFTAARGNLVRLWHYAKNSAAASEMWEEVNLLLPEEHQIKDATICTT